MKRKKVVDEAEKYVIILTDFQNVGLVSLRQSAHMLYRGQNHADMIFCRTAYDRNAVKKQEE